MVQLYQDCLNVLSEAQKILKNPKIYVLNLMKLMDIFKLVNFRLFVSAH